MVQVVVTADQAKLLAESKDFVEIVDASGNRIGTLLRPPNDEDVQIAKQRLEGGGKRFTTEEVVSQLRSLNES
ncbi:MAG: hypothetical protein AAF802_32020 [Planctomycetota bacterium]